MYSVIANPLGGLSLVLLSIVFLSSIVAFGVLCQALLPELIARGSRNLTRRPFRSALVGLINVLFFGLLALALIATRRPPIRLLGAILGVLVLGVVSVGIVVVGRVVGERLRPDDEPVRQQVLGTTTLGVSMLLPFVGWYLLTVLAGLSGSGAFILGAVWRPERPPAQVEDEELSARRR